MYHSSAKTFSGTGPQALAASRTPAAWVIVQSRAGNAGTMRIVDSVATLNGTVTPTTGGTVLAVGGSITMPFGGAPGFYDLENIYAVEVTNNDGVDISYGA